MAAAVTLSSFPGEIRLGVLTNSKDKIKAWGEWGTHWLGIDKKVLPLPVDKP